MSTLRLAILGQSPCEKCYAACCKQNGHVYAALLAGDEIRKFAAFAVDAVIDAQGFPIVERVLPYREGRCIFLGEDGLCTVYDDRPAACRAFQCVSQYNRNGLGIHGEFLLRNPRVRQMLDDL